MLSAKKFEKNYFYLCSTISYACLSTFITIYFSKFITGNDAFLYLSIANKYAHGHFYAAVNDYWSPLLSWLLAPFLFLKVDLIISVRIVQFIAGGITLIAFLKIIKLFNLIAWLQLCSTLIAILLITYFSVEETPDVLFAGLLLWYLYFTTSEAILPNNRVIALTGILGALLYFSKAIGFYIFLFYILACIIYWFLKKDGSYHTIAKRYFTILFVFLLISLIWITVLSFKYHHLTISDAGKYNFAIVGPGNISLQGIKEPLKHPINNGIYQLPDSFSLNYWERPQISTVTMQWTPFSSKNDFNFFLHLANQNLLRLYYDVLFRLFFLLWLLSTMLYIFVKKENPLKNFKILSITLLVALLTLLYIGIFIVPRYLFPVEILLFIVTLYYLNEIISITKITKITSALIIGILTISTCRYWLININRYDKSRKDFDVAFSDINKIKINGSLVSLQSDYDAMLKTSLLSYYTQNAYLGQIPVDSLRNKNYSSLTNDKVKYLFAWNTTTAEDTLFTNFTMVFLDTTSHLKIFDITKLK